MVTTFSSSSALERQLICSHTRRPGVNQFANACLQGEYKVGVCRVLCVYVRTCVYVCVCILTGSWRSSCFFLYTQVTGIHTYTHTYICTHIQTHTHIHTQTYMHTKTYKHVHTVNAAPALSRGQHKRAERQVHLRCPHEGPQGRGFLHAHVKRIAHDCF
jgi:hypothetical protein